MKSKLTIALLASAMLTACVPIPTIEPKPSIAKLDQNIPALANGNTWSQFELVNIFTTGQQGLGQDRQSANRYLYSAVDHGDARAHLRMVQHYYKSKTADQLMDDAFWLYGLAVRGHTESAYSLSRLYEEPLFPLFDHIESCKWLLVARRWVTSDKVQCDTKVLSEQEIAEAKKRAQPIINSLSATRFDISKPLLP